MTQIFMGLHIYLDRKLWRCSGKEEGKKKKKWKCVRMRWAALEAATRNAPLPTVTQSYLPMDWGIHVRGDCQASAVNSIGMCSDRTAWRR